MVRLIASDIDGTLLQNGEAGIPGEIFAEIHRLERKGIFFCPASGRQYHSMRRLFAPVADKVPFLCENGAVIFGPGSPGPVLGKIPMPRRDADALCGDILDHPELEVLISGERTSYLCPRGNDIVHIIRDVTGNNTVIVPRPEDVPEDIVKIAAYCPRGTAPYEREMADRWGGSFNVAVAGETWLDFTLADKGTGLAALCGALGYDMSEVMAFGDNFNDLSMLQSVGYPYLMENAADALKAMFPTRCVHVADVLRTL